MSVNIEQLPLKDFLNDSHHATFNEFLMIILHNELAIFDNVYYRMICYLYAIAATDKFSRL